MIEEILIRDLGVISEAKLEFGPGLTVLTGETGAGKTMVLNALGLLLGERSDSSAIRKGQEQAFVEGRWLLADSALTRIRELGIELEDAELLVNRSVSAEGRSRAALSGKSVPVGILSEIGEQLVVVHGQSDQIRLRSAAAQREALDQFAGEDLSKVMTEYTSVYANWKQAASRLSEITTQLEARSREADQIRSAVEELTNLDPKPGEDVELAEKASKLTHLEELRIAATAAHNQLSSEGFDDSSDAITLIGKARRSLEAVSEHDPELASLAQQLKEIGFSLNETSASISGYLASLDSEGGQELERVQQRRADLTSAMRKYGPTLEEVISYFENSGARLLELDSSDKEIQELTALEQSLGKQATSLAKTITELRTKAASALAKSVTGELSALAMTGASLEVTVSQGSELGATGADQVAILLSAYPGAEPRPLGKGASGGELSRIMLAIEVVLAGSELAPTFIFDEVDAGVGGAAATEVGKRLATLAQNAQVIVVTHLPQVAAFATRHLRVLKSVSDQYTSTDVVRLEGEAVVEELARMLSGLSESESGKTHAKELLELAKASI
ncbi:MAG: DNA repair protein RecN [Actinobacteria bacterium]|uniref:DNA repair protein RecN n=1 Tax=freshwater metagenome TaxID=449393 RepID=A0A6J7CTW4_9ZZZZ|nr:DNA repair protein RecN [Actinomycetota bacterium]